MSDKFRIVAGIPAYNEESTIAKVIIRTQKHVDRVIVVDDGSTDDTRVIAERLGAVVVGHERRLGYGSAIITCFRAAKDLGADILVTLDADSQHDPNDIPNLVEPIRQGLADIVLGSRFLESSDDSQMPKYREVGVKLLTKFTDAASHGQVSDSQCGFRAYNRKVLQEIVLAEQGMGVSVEILMKAAENNLRIVEVPIAAKYTGLKTSTHNPFYHILDVVGSVVKFVSIRHPLMFFGALAVIAFTVTIIFAAWAIDIFSREGRLVTNMVLIALGSGFIGVSALFTAIILFVLINVIREKTTI